MDSVTRVLIGLGLLFFIAAGWWYISGSKFPLFNLPGDLHFEVGNTKIFLPLTSSLLLSGIFSFFAYLFNK